MAERLAIAAVIGASEVPNEVRLQAAFGAIKYVDVEIALGSHHGGFELWGE